MEQKIEQQQEEQQDEYNQYQEPKTQFEKDLLSNNKDLFLETRELILSYPQMMELQKSIITTFANDNGPICNMRTMNKTLEITFLKGINLKDKHKLLTGSGKEMRSLTIDNLDKEILSYYIQQAIKINERKRR